MKDYGFDTVIIMKKFIDEKGVIHFYPFKTADGRYDEESGLFYDFDGTPYPHIISNPETFGYCDRVSLSSLKNGNRFFTLKRLKELRLKFDKKFGYILYPNYENLGFPMIKCFGKDNSGSFCDGDVVKYYYDNYTNMFLEIMAALEMGKVQLIKIDENGNEESFNDYSLEDIKKRIRANKEKKEESNNNFDVNKLYEGITSHVIGQDKPIKKLLGIIWKYYNNSDTVKPNILINGGTGVGKTEIFRVFSKMIDVPCVVTSATEYSATGYVGASIEDMLVKLIIKAGGDIKKAERGILVIDEIDKISESDKSRPQINQKDVQDGLLKVLEDGVITVKIGHAQYEFDTSHLLVIGMGSWCRAEKEESRSIGFNSTKKDKITSRDISPEEMVQNGMSKELIGRFLVHIIMNDLNFDDYVTILNSENHMISYNKKFFQDLGIKLTFDDGVIEDVARTASEGIFGARNLAKKIEGALSVAQFEISRNPDMYEELIITKETIKDEEKYVLVKKDLHK